MIWTLKAVNAKLEDLSAGDAHIEQGFKPGYINDRSLFNTFKEYSKANNKNWGYLCYDKYRPAPGQHDRGFRIGGKMEKRHKETLFRLFDRGMKKR